MPALADILKAVGPNASLVFAAWIFMNFLQQRYDSATSRYRESLNEYRAKDHEDERLRSLKDQVLTLQERCRLMGRATLIGLVAAILLILSLILGIVGAIAPKVPAVVVAGTGAAALGFLLVITSAAIVIAEGRIVSRQLHDELRDIPDLAGEPGRASSLQSRPSSS